MAQTSSPAPLASRADIDRACCEALHCLDDALELYSYVKGWPDEKRDRELWGLAKDSARSFVRLNPDDVLPPDELDLEVETILNRAAANQPDLARLGTSVASNHHQLARRFYVSLLEAAWFAAYGRAFDFRQFDPASGAIRFVQSWPAIRAAILAIPGCEPFFDLWGEERAWVDREHALAVRADIGTSGDDRNPEAEQPTLLRPAELRDLPEVQAALTGCNIRHEAFRRLALTTWPTVEMRTLSVEDPPRFFQEAAQRWKNLTSTEPPSHNKDWLALAGQAGLPYPVDDLTAETLFDSIVPAVAGHFRTLAESQSTKPAAPQTASEPGSADEPDDEDNGGCDLPRVDEINKGCAIWCGKRIHLGWHKFEPETKLSRLFFLLANHVGRPYRPAELLEAYDGPDANRLPTQGDVQRLHTAITRLRVKMREAELDIHFEIARCGPQRQPVYKMLRTFPHKR
ncbi:MAG: hypothetical protein ACYC35_26690 [Pirellulales bacterium]